MTWPWGPGHSCTPLFAGPLPLPTSSPLRHSDRRCHNLSFGSDNEVCVPGTDCVGRRRGFTV
jgi:hypothetical protein